LVMDGANIEVTNRNCSEYIEACFKYKMMDRLQAQLKELLLGMFELVPEPLLTIFDLQEIEWLIYGVPDFNIRHLETRTDYSGELEGVGRPITLFVAGTGKLFLS
jgi:hypothetical protein